MQKKSVSKDQKWLRARKLARLYGILTVFVFSFYFLAGFFLHPLFLVSDVREKIRAIADTVTVLARVLDPPVKPIVTGTGTCLSGGAAITLDWADDANSISYDIVRETLPLSTGVVVSGYTDTTVMPGQTYDYVVTALGPMGPGFSDSDPISFTAPSECAPTLIPSIAFQTFAGKNIAGTTERHFTTDRNPRLTGVTNIPNARVELTVRSGSDVIRSTVFANLNGYFAWNYGGKLDEATYDILVTATDPGDATLSVTEKLKIGIESEISQSQLRDETPTREERPAVEKPVWLRPDFDFILRLAEREAYAGETARITVEWQHLPDQLLGTEGNISFRLIDGNGTVVDESVESFVFSRENVIGKDFTLPYGADKEYRARVEVWIPSYRVSHEETFQVRPLPLLQLGNTTIDYEQAVSQLGWSSLLFLLLFFWWLLLFFREYFLYLRSTRSVTGKDLHAAGYF